MSAKELAADSERVLDRVIEGGETVQVQRQGKIVAQIIPAGGVSREQLRQALLQVHWTAEESQEMKRAADSSSEVFGFAGGD